MLPMTLMGLYLRVMVMKAVFVVIKKVKSCKQAN